MTPYIRAVHGNRYDSGHRVGDGRSLVAWIKQEVQGRSPWKITIAGDLQDEPANTRPVATGGVGFGSQSAGHIVHPVRAILIERDGGNRSMAAGRDALLGRYDGDALSRVIHTGSHDEDANGRARAQVDDSGHKPGFDVDARDEPGALRLSGDVGLGPYSALILIHSG